MFQLGLLELLPSLYDHVIVPKQWCWNSIGVGNWVVRYPMPYSDMKPDDRSRHLASLTMTQV